MNSNYNSMVKYERTDRENKIVYADKNYKFNKKIFLKNDFIFTGREIQNQCIWERRK